MQQISEAMPIVGRIKAQTVTAAATVTSDIIDMKYHRRVRGIFNMGDYAAGNDGAVAVKFQASNDGSSFTSAVDVTGKTLTAASFTGSAQDDCIATIEVSSEEMVISGTGYRYLRMSVTPTNQNLTCGAVIEADGDRYGPATEFDLTAVTEVIA